ncbi:thermonuclease family protein [Brevundimonas sp. NPDC090276]|uniref:thermonuclease family protein n=1 Tax=Brevundimonas sp. NPDC090276 TaxID=3363956 RepID=UPI00383BADFE
MRFQTFAAALVLILLSAAWLTLDDDRGKTAAYATAPSLARPPADADLSCQVAYVHDGDSLRCQDGIRIRLHAVAAREKDETCARGHPCPAASAAAATLALKRLTEGRDLACRSIGRSYDRVTAICWTPEGTEVNCAMIRSGTTEIWPRYDRQTPICA